MDKVFLLTFHGSVNYGAVLQAFSLNKTIMDLGFDCEVIDYNREVHHRNFLKLGASTTKGKLYQISQIPNKYRLHKRFNNFTKSKMFLTSISYNGSDSLKKSNFPSNSTYIVGSDQIWNCELTGNDLNYYLDFVDSENKYSYAASFAVEDISNWKIKNEVQQLLNKFKRISVREESGQKLLKKEFDLESDVVCDPTFLLTREQWNNVAKVKESNKYILLFIFNKNEKLIEKAKELSKQKNIPIYNIAYCIKDIIGIKDIKCAGPREWLGYIKNAEYVFTNSFHGFALSLNFNKQVWTALSIDGKNSRIFDLAQRYGVSNRIIDQSFNKEDINYEEVNKKIDIDRSYSLLYLEEILNESKQ